MKDCKKAMDDPAASYPFPYIFLPYKSLSPIQYMLTPPTDPFFGMQLPKSTEEQLFVIWRSDPNALPTCTVMGVLHKSLNVVSTHVR